MENDTLGKADKGTRALPLTWKAVAEEQKCKELCWSAIRGTMKALSNDTTPVQMHCEWHGINCDPTDPANQPPQPQKANKNGGVTYSPPGGNFVKAAGDLFHYLLILCTTLPRYEQAPPRWHWQEIVVAELKQIGEVSTSELELAMVCCQIP